MMFTLTLNEAMVTAVLEGLSSMPLNRSLDAFVVIRGQMAEQKMKLLAQQQQPAPDPAAPAEQPANLVAADHPPLAAPHQPMPTNPGPPPRPRPPIAGVTYPIDAVVPPLDRVESGKPTPLQPPAQPAGLTAPGHTEASADTGMATKPPGEVAEPYI
jgi:hypothetical protein